MESEEETFRCYRNFKEETVGEDGKKKRNFTRKLVTMKKSDLPEGNVLIKVYYSALNYKDCLSC